MSACGVGQRARPVPTNRALLCSAQLVPCSATACRIFVQYSGDVSMPTALRPRSRAAISTQSTMPHPYHAAWGDRASGRGGGFVGGDVPADGVGPSVECLYGVVGADVLAEHGDDFGGVLHRQVRRLTHHDHAPGAHTLVVAAVAVAGQSKLIP